MIKDYRLIKLLSGCILLGTIGLWDTKQQTPTNLPDGQAGFGYLIGEEVKTKNSGKLTESQVKEIEELIRNLGNDDWQIRESAQKIIIEMGKDVEPWLREALNNNDIEIRLRAEKLLDQINEGNPCIIEGELWANFIGDSLSRFHVPYFSEKGDMVCILSCLKGPIRGIKNSCVDVPSDAVITIKDTKKGKTAVFAKGSANKIEEIIEELSRKPRVSDIDWLKLLFKGEGFQFITKDDPNLQADPLKANIPCIIEGRLIWKQNRKFDEYMPYINEASEYSLDCLPRGFVKCLPNYSPAIDSEDTLSIKDLKTGKTAVFAKGSTKKITKIIEEFKRQPRVSDINWFYNLVNHTARSLSSSFRWLDKDYLNMRDDLINIMSRVLKSEQTYENASLSIVNGIPLLQLSGTPEEVGTQYGTILKDILKNIPAYLKFSDIANDTTMNNMLRLTKKIEGYLPSDIRTEMQAIAKASDIDYETLLIINTIPNFYNVFLSGVVACELKSVEGTPIFGGNINLFNNPITPPDIQLVVVYHIKGKKSFASVTFPGMIGCFTGMNEYGLCLGNILVSNAKGNPASKGLPSALINRVILENASNIEEASQIIEKSEKITPGNLILCDEKTAKVVEYSPSQICYRLPDKDTLFATNYFFTEEMSYTTVSQNEWGLELLLSSPETKVTTDQMKFIMNSIALEDSIQCLIFLPSKKSFYLSFGKSPVTDWSFTELSNNILFGK